MLLLDTDVLTDILRGYAPAIEWFETLDPAFMLYVSGYSAMELFGGARNRKEHRDVERLLARFTTVWLSEEGCRRALWRFAANHLQQGAGIIDTLIAETAVATQLAICTFNVKHYRHIPEIRLVSLYERR